MTDIKPYLIRAVYEWMADNQLTPLLLVDATREGLEVPSTAIVDGKVVLNISQSATDGLEIGNQWISCNARFSGTQQHLLIPVTAVQALYARENGKGMAFDTDPDAPGNPPDGDGPEPAATAKKPFLRLVE